jgi:hypothetical protein
MRAKDRAAEKRANLPPCDCSGGFCHDESGAYRLASCSCADFLTATMCAAQSLPECMRLPIRDTCTQQETQTLEKENMPPKRCFGVRGDWCQSCGLRRAFNKLPLIAVGDGEPVALGLAESQRDCGGAAAPSASSGGGGAKPAASGDCDGAEECGEGAAAADDDDPGFIHACKREATDQLLVWHEFLRTPTGKNKAGEDTYVQQWMPVTGTRKLFFKKLYVSGVVDACNHLDAVAIGLTGPYIW